MVPKLTITAVIIPNPAAIHASRSRFLSRPLIGRDVATDDPLSPIHFSSLARSLALCHRSSGVFARHFFTAWSSAGGVIGLIVLIGAASFSRIADATLS